MNIPSLDVLGTDLRHALRKLRRSPGFSLAAIATIGLGLGLNTAAFTIFDSVALRPLAVRAPKEIMRVVRADDRGTGYYLRYSDVERLGREGRVFSSVVASSAPQAFVGMIDREAPENARAITGRFVSPEYFQALGVPAARGHTFTSGETQVAVVSHDFWSRRLGADAGAVGRTIAIGDVRLTIIGVTPRDFAGTGLPPTAPDFWVPLAMQPRLLPGADWLHDDAHREWQVLARLAPGISTAQASAGLTIVAQTLPPIDHEPVKLAVKRATFFQADSGEFETFTQAGAVVMAGVALLLAIGCINLVSLISARNASRWREVTLRIALGASRARVAWQLCAESAVLGLAGGAVGIAVSAALSRWLDLWIHGTMSRVLGSAAAFALDLSPNWHVVVYAAALSLVAGVAVGIWPALQAARRDASVVLKQGGQATEGGSPWGGRNLLLTAQVTGSLVLLTGAALLFGGVSASRAVDPGFDVGHALVVSIYTYTRALAATPAARTVAMRRVVARLGEVPEVRAVAWAELPPFLGHHLRTGDDGLGLITIARDGVSDSYFDAFRIPLIAGRPFTPDEVERDAPVAIISASLARRYWPGQDALGRTTAAFPMLARDDKRPYTIVGVARDVRHTYLSRPDAGFEYYPLPLASSNGLLMLGTRVAAANAVAPVRAALAAVDPSLALQSTIVTMQDGPMAIQRLMAAAPATLAATLATFGLFLTAVGLWGVVAQMVVRRTREIGIRTALGATRLHAVTIVLRKTLRPVVWGAAFGALGSLGVSSGLAALVRMPDAPDLTYGRGAFDPLAFLVVFAVLATVITLASFLPATRAARVDPLVALRAE